MQGQKIVAGRNQRSNKNEVRTRTEARKRELVGQKEHTLSKKGTGANSLIGSSKAKADLSIGSPKAAAGSSETAADEEATVGPCAVPRSVVRADAAIALIEVSRPAVPTAVEGVSC